MNNAEVHPPGARPPLYTITDEECAHLPDFTQTQTPENGDTHPKTRNAQIGDPPAKKPTKAEERAAARQQDLEQLLLREQALQVAASKPVVFSPPLISRHDIGFIGRGTINIAQGAFGSHKSRFAELLAALILTRNMDAPQFLAFQRVQLERFCLCYIDTERNQSEELPFAIQGIKLKAGYALTDQPDNFRFTSIKAIERARRFDAIEAFISHVRQSTPLHLFCVIDVVTDAVGDFNDAKESMRLYDFIGNLCDEQDATFLLVIHQNPGTDKARGHTGTEAANKASTVFQIGFEKDGNGNDSDLIRLRCIKLRRGKRPEPLYLQYSEEAKGLVLADAASVAAHVNYRKHKADSEDIADRLVSLLSEGPLPKHEVWTKLEHEFKAKNATIRARLKTIIDEPPEMYDEEGRAVRLADYKEGRDQFFKLSLIE